MGDALRRHRAARSALIALAIGVVWIAIGRPVAAQSFGRATATGNWGDSFWVDASGTIGPLPASDADAYIASGSFPDGSSLANATVNLSGNRSAASVTLGRQSGDTGALVIQPGSTLTTSNLAIGSDGGVGTLTLAPGGALTIANSLTAGSTGGASTINLNGQTISAGTYSQNGPVTLNRGAGGGFQATQFSIQAGNFNVQAGDSFTGSGSVSGGATVSNSVAMNLSESLSVSENGTNYTAAAPLSLGRSFFVGVGSTFSANAQMTVDGLLSGFGSQVSGVFNVNAPLTAPTGHFSVTDAGAMNINANVALSSVSAFNSGVLNLNLGTLSASTLSISLGSGLNRTAGTYDVGDFFLGGVSLAYQGSDDISNRLSLSSGAAFTLNKDLMLTGDLTVDNSTLNLNGRQATVGSFTRIGNAAVQRGPGGKIQGQNLSISGGAPYVLDGTDAFTGSASVSNGAEVSNTVPVTLSNGLSVFGNGTRYTAAAPLSLGGFTGLSVGAGSVFNANAELTVEGFSFFSFQVSGVFNANAPLTSTNRLFISDGGALNVNANVAITSVFASNFGKINLNSGTFTASDVSVSGSSSINRTGGTYDFQSLSLSDGASLVYLPADDLDGSLSLAAGTSFTLQKNLTLSGNLSVDNATLNLNGRPTTVGSLTRIGNAVINRGAGGHFQGYGLSIIGGAPYVLNGTDVFTGSVSVSGGATVSNTVPVNLESSLSVSGTGSSYTAAAPLSVGFFGFSVSAGSVFNANAEMSVGGGNSQVSGVFNANFPLTSTGNLNVGDGRFNVNAPVTFNDVSVSSLGVINLNSGTFTAARLSVSSSGTINRVGGTYDVGDLTLRDGASLVYLPTDVLDGSLSLAAGASFTLQKNLTLSGNLSVDNATLNLNGRPTTVGSLTRVGNAVINRGAGGHFQGQGLSIIGGAPYVLNGTDVFTGSVSVSSGATVSNTVPVNLESGLTVSGNGSSYTVAAPLSLGVSGFSIGAGSVLNANAAVTFSSAFAFDSQVNGVLNANAPLTGHGNLAVRDGGVVNVNANVGFDSISMPNSSLINLNSGTLAAGSVNVSGGGRINAQNNVDLDANLSLAAGAAVTVFQSLGDATGLTLDGDLSLDPAASINLSFDSLQGPGAIDFAFRWVGDHVATLTALLGTRIIATGAPKPVSIVYDPAKYDDFTYIAFIPILGDLNGDGDIDPADYLNLSTNLLTNVSGMAALDTYFLGDINGDRRIDGKDFVLFRTTYDEVNGAGAFAAMVRSVPEPSSIALAAIVCAACAATSRRR